MREMKDSGIEWIGEIPRDWNVCKVKDGFVRKNSKAQEENPIVLSLARNGVKIRDMSNAEGQFADSYYNYNPVDIDDLLLNPMDLISGDNCSISYVKGVISPAYTNLRYKKGIFPKFYHYYFKYQYWCKAFFSYGKGVSYENRWTLNNETIMNYRIMVPSFVEQKKIANFLDTKCSEIDSLVEDINSEIKTLEEYKKSVITEAVTKGLNPDAEMKDSEIEWIGEIPEDWEVSRLKYLVKKKITDGTHQTPEYDDETTGSPFLSSKDITSGKINWSDIKYITQNLHKKLHNETKTQKDDILLAKNGTTGVAAIVEDDRIFDIYVTLALIRSNTDIILPKYLLYLINSNIAKKQFDEHLVGVGVPNLHLNVINNIALPYARDLEVQSKIISFLDKKVSEIDSAVELKKEQLETLAEYKKSLIYEYVTGKKEVV